jgi:hypothetical protein
MLAGCVSISYSKTGNYIDYSYPVYGALLEEGTIFYTKQKYWFWKQRRPPVSAQQKEGIAITCLSDSIAGFGKTSGPLPQSEIFIINTRHDIYDWKGTIEYSDAKIDADISIDVYGNEDAILFMLNKKSPPQGAGYFKIFV